MTTQEFSDMFDSLLSSYSNPIVFGESASKADIVLDEYEKSIYLTKAQEALIQDIYSGKYQGDTFEKTEEARRQLDALIEQKECECSDSEHSLVAVGNNTHTLFKLPSDCWYIVYEQATWGDSAGDCLAGKVVDVVPVKHDEYYRAVNNPFRGPNNRRVLRLDVDANTVELISNHAMECYLIRYIRKPSPIILCDLTGSNLSIDNILSVTECELSEVLHQEILDRAVMLVISLKTNKSNKDSK